jgi:hypothetical protein
MRTSHWLPVTTLLLTLSSAAEAQMYVGPTPRVYVAPQVRWHARRFYRAGVYVAPGQVWVGGGVVAAPPPPPPPVVVETPPPVYYPPVYPPAPVYPPPAYPPPAAPPAPAPTIAPTVVVQQMARPDWTDRFGLGATGEGLFNVYNGDSKGWGVLGQLRYRVARHLALELTAGYERSTQDSGPTRTDVPVAFGLMIPLVGPEHILAPYLVGAVGLNFANLRLIDSPSYSLEDDRTQFLANGGGGLELRLGHHFAINADLRVEGRWNIGGPSAAVAATTSIDGKPVQPLESTLGLRLGVGGTVYF